MVKFKLPEWVRKHNKEYDSINNIPEAVINQLRNKLSRFNVEDPEVSIVIPAYNEEKNILKALSSLSEINIKYRTEIIVANNNSKDKTQEVLDLVGVKSVFAENQGISYARQAGLEAAKGKYILNADADSIYPPTWGNDYVEVLKDSNISCAYGTYSFIPSDEGTRAYLAVYETIARSMFALKRQNKNRECVNVMGFNFAFRKEDGVRVGGYNHELNRKVTGRSEDGWMALCLQKTGDLKFLPTSDLTVWTSDRRLMMDGGIKQAFTRRFKKEISRIGLYLKPNTVK